MNTLAFCKMQAQGNDFIILDGRGRPLPDIHARLVTRMADRRLGIGCDQVLILLPGENERPALSIFNSDGSQAETCGNGLRCIGGLLLEDNAEHCVEVSLADRIVRMEETEHGIRAHMGAACIESHNDMHVDVNIGNPHRVFFAAVEDFPDDRNIEIVSGQIGDDVYIDIIERGAGRTPSCGSGACATAVAVWLQDGHQRPQRIHMPGGVVRVSGSPDDVLLEGEVAFVCRGEYRLPKPEKA